MRNKVIVGILVLAGLILLHASLFTVREGEQVVIVRFGEVQRVEDAPGLHVKAPFVDDPREFERRWLGWDGEPTQVTTADKRFIAIDIFARWRISDPLVYIEKLGNETRAQSRLDDIVESAARNVVANHKLIEVIRTTNRAFALSNEEMMAAGAARPLTPGSGDAAAVAPEPAAADADGGVEDEAAGDGKAEVAKATGDAEAVPPPAPEQTSAATADASSVLGESTMGEEMTYSITAGRKKLTQLILARAEKEVAKLGIELRDVQFKRIDYVETVQTKVFDRMVSERRRVAEAFRSQGQGMSAEILGKKERDLKTIRSEAYRQAQEIRGRADGEAAAIYAEAYKADPAFYRFVRTLESYEETVDENTWLLLSTDADYARQLTTMKGQ
jgi:membrane protease subunit HflC